jgi:hypothetical protein
LYFPYWNTGVDGSRYCSSLREAILANPSIILDIFSTNAITDPKKTDFAVEYKEKDGNRHKYTSDFIVRRTDGKCMIVETKREKERDDVIDGLQGQTCLPCRN